MVKDKKRIFFVPVSNVLWIEATGNYACIHIAKDSHLLRETLAHLEEKLAPHHFIRVRKSAIVNGACISEIRNITDVEQIVIREAIQYCMPLPAHYMASTLYPNLETIRTSNDRLTPQKWDIFLYDSRLANAVGLWPWTDVFFSSELGNLIVSALSAGPVGVGDALGEINPKNLMTVVRPDGFLIKPDSPLLPIDSMYLIDAANGKGPMIAQAETKFANSFARYVFSYPRDPAQTEVSVSLTDLGVVGPAFAFDWIGHTGTLISSGGALSIRLKDGFAYNVVVPVNVDGLALLGDTEKIVTLGRQRVSSLEDHGTLTATIKFAPGEDVRTISGFAAHEPKLKAEKGHLKGFIYDAKTDMFQVQMVPGSNGEAVLRLAAH